MTDNLQSKSKNNDSSPSLERRAQEDESKSKRKSNRHKYLSKLGLESIDDNSKIDNNDEEGSDDELTVKYSVQILGTDLRKIKGEKSFTVYKIEITRDISSWLIYRRYSQFFSLFTELKSKFGDQVPKKFPPKVIKQNLSPQNIDRRHQMLEEWLIAVLSETELRQHESVQVFIRQDKEDVDFVPRQKNTVLSDIDIQGQLYKLHNGKWKDRYFVLRHGLLYKYETKEDKHPFNFYDVRDAVATIQEDKLPKAKTNLFIFAVEIPDRKKKHLTTHHFAADNEELRNNWISLINKEARLKSSNKVFGVALEDVRERDDNGVPLFLSAMLTFLQATAHDQDDLFTQPPDEKIKKEIDEGNSIDLQSVVNNAHAVAGLIVQYLHELPQPIIKHEYQDCLFGIFKIQDETKRNKMFKHFSEIIPIINRNLLMKLFSFLAAISKSGETKRERLVKIFGRLVIRPAIDLDHSFLTFLFNQMIDNWALLEVEGEKYVPVLATKRRSVSLAKRESKRNLLESKEISKDKSNKDNKAEKNKDNADNQKGTPKSPRREKGEKTKREGTKKNRDKKSPKSTTKDKSEEVVINATDSTEQKNSKDKADKPKKNVGFEQKDEPAATSDRSTVESTSDTSMRSSAELKVLSTSTSTKSTRSRIVSELPTLGTIEKKPQEPTVDTNPTTVPSIVINDKKEDIAVDTKVESDTQTTVVTTAPSKDNKNDKHDDVSTSEDSDIESSDSEASSTSEASMEHLDTSLSVPRIELDSKPIDNKDEPDTPLHKNDKDSSEEDVEVRTSPRLSMVKRPKATKHNRPTSARVSIPPGAIPPIDDESNTNKAKPPSIVVVSPQQQFLSDLNKALGNRAKK